MFDDATGKSVEAFCADRVIAAARDNQVLLGYKAHGINAGVEDVAVLVDDPVELLNRLVEISEVPQFDSFAKGASACDHILVVM